MMQCLSLSNRRLTRSGDSRRGAVIPLVAVFLVVLFALAAISIDLAYLQLVRTQLRATTDLAAKAAASALLQGQTDAQAQAAAIAVAAQNKVAGHALVLTAADFSFGQPQQQADGSWAFVAGLTPSHAVKINSKLFSNNANGAVKLFFAPVLGVSSLQTQDTSVASAFQCDLSLCLDRSGSMKWDTSGIDWDYPPYGSSNTRPKHGSRWYALRDAVSTFTGILGASNAPPRVGVVTWSDYSTTDLGFTTDMTAVYNAVNYWSSVNFGGSTDMQEGMSYSVSQLTGASARTYAKKIMVLMSDGEWNQGSNPVTYAATAKAAGITIHTISFLAGGSGPTALSQIAAATGGTAYVADDAASLEDAFEKIAYSLPVVLIQ